MARRRTRSNPAQLSLFDTEDPLREEHERARELAKHVDPLVRFGTNSWSYPGWHKLVYPKKCTPSELSRTGLGDYSRHPLLRTVGLDRAYHRALEPQELQQFGAQLPLDFVATSKVPWRLTSAVVRDERGAPQGRNADFLNPEHFLEAVLPPFVQQFSSRMGPFVFEFPAVPKVHRGSPAEFAERLERFFEALPAGYPYAVELRDPALLTRAYASVLERRGVAHVYNRWRAMPSPEEQAKTVPLAQNPYLHVRVLLQEGTYYADCERDFAPFDKLHTPNEALRSEVVSLVRQAISLRKASFVLVSNKAEGSSPLTIRALAERLASAG